MTRNEIMEQLEQLKPEAYVYAYGKKVDVTFKTDNPTPNKGKIAQVLAWLHAYANEVEGRAYKYYYFDDVTVCVGMFKA